MQCTTLLQLIRIAVRTDLIDPILIVSAHPYKNKSFCLLTICHEEPFTVIRKSSVNGSEGACVNVLK